MTGFKAIIALCLLCAAGSAVGIESAGAEIKGTTGFTCKEKKEPGGAGFSGAHCKASDVVGTGAKYEHVAIAENVTTEGKAVNLATGGEKVTAKLMTTVAGIAFELQATETFGNATGTNKKAANGEHFIEGFGKTTYSGVTVTKPAGKGCKVKGGTIESRELRGTSVGMEGKLEPAVGTTFLELTVEGCSTPSLNNTYVVSGSVSCPGDGATALCTEAATTAQGTLKFGGQKTGVEQTTTATGRANSSEEFTPLAVTTVETP